MQTRTYVVKMPAESASTPLDILVENNPGTQGAPVTAADAAYYEILGRPVRIPNPASDSSSFVPRCRLGVGVAIVPYNVGPSMLPNVQLSESLVGDLSSTEGGPAISITPLADPDGAAIRLTGSSDTEGAFFLLTLYITEAADTDRAGTGKS